MNIEENIEEPLEDTDNLDPNQPMGMRASINAKCRDCSYDSLDRGTWRNQVLHCCVKSCALYPHRPMPVGFKYRNARYLEEFPDEA